ncbi:MAG: right-handed parallel beta-helix repeat-containing protein [Fimbriimonadaceae bacterium]|nr:right-handed parallel beta-helix repeat-containing protein [Fimbriimonadaceae bacterium]
MQPHLLGLLAGLALTAPGLAATTFHAAPDGDDGWTGLVARPNAARGDGPVRSLAGARDAVRRWRQAGGGGAVEVVFAAGDYPLSAAVTFGPQDGGSAEAPVVYAGAPGARPRISGGRRISGWQRGAGGVWYADLPDVAPGRNWFRQLWVNGRRAVRARTPNSGYLRIAGLAAGIKAPERGNAQHCIGFTMRPGELDPAELVRSDRREACLVLYHSWTNSQHFIQSIEGTQVRFTNRSGWPVGQWERQQRYHVENVRSGLDQPGEWYLEAGRIEYLPRPGEDLATAEVIAPTVNQLVVLAGDPEAGLPVSHLTFRGLSFQHTDWQQAPTVSLDGQAATFLNGAVQTRGANRCTFEDCEVAHVGSYGIWLERGSQDNLVQRCELWDLAGGGVRIGDSNEFSGANLVARNTVDNCFIHHGGEVFNGACGVLVQRSSFNRITRNEISDLYYTGISVGWSWGFAATTAHDNLVQGNQVHHLGWGVMSDMGGIYTLGVSPGTRIVGNSFHDVLCYENGYGGWGLYTDEGSSNIVLQNNLVYNTTDGSFHQHYGADNLVRNNILVNSAKAQVKRSREDKRCHFTFERNLVVWQQGDLLGGPHKNNDVAYRQNLYWQSAGQPVEFLGSDLATWQHEGYEQGSLLADPLFLDAANHDYRLRDGSPASRVGFEPWDLSAVGLYGDPAWVARPQALSRPAMVFPAPPRPLVLDDGFEAAAVGDPPARARVSGETAQATVQVSAEQPASGQRCLKVQDAAGLTPAWQPHFYWQPNYRRGLATARFDLRIEAGVKLYHEWRDNSIPFKIGPSLHIETDGRLLVGGQALATLPAGQWCRFEISRRLGAGHDGTWTLTLTLPGAAPQTFRGLASNPAMRSLEWFGFVADGAAAKAYWLDNLQLSTKE